MANAADEREDVLELKQICKEIKKLIAREKKEAKEGYDESEDISKLEQALSLCEEVEANEAKEAGEEQPAKKANPFASKKAPAVKENAATMPMEALRAKLPEAKPPVSQGNLNAY